ncbi:MAG: DUF3857 domain-containing protein [Myxococcales bacterium]|nr:DUF3857 domain-containing protein [Myxococcales bacterium]
MSPDLARSLSLLALLLSPAALPKPGGPAAERAEKRSREALAQYHSPRAVAALVRLHGLKDELEDLNPLAHTYAALLSRRGTDPFARAIAHRLYADVERARGHSTKARALLEPLGFIQRYWVVGGFDNEGKAGCNTTHGPEGAAIDLQATYPTRGREAGWRRLTAATPDGFVDLSTLVRPSSETVAYALTFLEAPEEARVQLWVGASGAFRLWVNGQPVASEDRYNLPNPDQARVQVRLRKGPNRVLLKVCHERGPLGFYLRSERADPKGAAASPVLLAVVPPHGKGPGPEPVSLPTAANVLAREVKKRPSEAALLGDFAVVLHHFRSFDEPERTDTLWAEKAAELAPGDAELQLLAAMLERDDHNQRRKHLEAAVKVEPSHPLARLELAELELSLDHPERALQILEALVKEHPRYGAAVVAHARALEELGEWPKAAMRLEAAVRELPHVPDVTRQAARVARRLSRLEEVVFRLRTAVALRHDDSGSRRSLADTLSDLGRVEEAAAQLRALLELNPLDNSSRLRLAELYSANGRAEESAMLFAESKELSPDEPEVHEREGRALLYLGKREEAIGAFGRALALRPQNPALRETLRSLRGEDAPVGTQYLLDVRPLVSRADSFAGEDAVTLADYTFVRVQPSGQSSRLHQVAVKVYTDRGVEALRSFPITYSPDRQEVRVLKARLIKPDGSVVESYGEADRHINEPWTGMYYDARAKVLSFPALAPMDVLELQYRLDDTALENLLSDYWGDVDYVQSVSPKLRYRYFVEMPAARKLYWNRSKLPPGVEVKVDPERDGSVLYRFSVDDVPKVVPEPSMPGWAEVVTTLHVSTYRTWEEVGRYYWGLVRDQLTPNEELKRTVEKVLKDVDRKDELAVVRAVYDFVVMNTRYVALEFGIHGYKPYRVDRVLARRFGDCKDKASLMHAMLKAVGIDSRLVLLRMRHLGSIGEEPASLAAFNHAILYLPRHKLYLDGTAEFHGSRELPSADRVANVLVVEPEGPSPFDTTPEARAEENATTLSMEVALRPDGSGSAVGKSTVTGVGAPDYRRAYQAVATRKATFEQGWAQTFPGLTVKEMSISDPTKLEEGVGLSFALEVPRYAEAPPGALRFHPFGSGRSYTQTYAPLSERKFDLVLSGPWTNSFRFSYRLPPGYAVAELPPDAKEESSFGRVVMSARKEGDVVVCEGEVTFSVARVKAEDYPAFRAWLGRVDQLFARKLNAGEVGN